MPKFTPSQIGRLVYLVDAYGRHQHTIGQLNMINLSDRASAFDEVRDEEKRHSKDTRDEISEFIELLFD